MEIKVGPLVYGVVEVEDLRSEKGELLYGEADHTVFEIRLAKGLPEQAMFVTRWHEVVHCIEAIYGLSLSERTVTVLGSAIAQVLQDNPEMRGPKE